jgi:hypothetical protein
MRGKKVKTLEEEEDGQIEKGEFSVGSGKVDRESDEKCKEEDRERTKSPTKRVRKRHKAKSDNRSRRNMRFGNKL